MLSAAGDRVQDLGPPDKELCWRIYLSQFPRHSIVLINCRVSIHWTHQLAFPMTASCDVPQFLLYLAPACVAFFTLVSHSARLPSLPSLHVTHTSMASHVTFLCGDHECIHTTLLCGCHTCVLLSHQYAFVLISPPPPLHVVNIHVVLCVVSLSLLVLPPCR